MHKMQTFISTDCLRAIYLFPDSLLSDRCGVQLSQAPLVDEQADIPIPVGAASGAGLGDSGTDQIGHFME